MPAAKRRSTTVPRMERTGVAGVILGLLERMAERMGSRADGGREAEAAARGKVRRGERARSVEKVRRMQLKPEVERKVMMEARGWRWRHSGWLVSRWAGQLAQRSLTREPLASTIQRLVVEWGRASWARVRGRRVNKMRTGLRGTMVIVCWRRDGRGPEVGAGFGAGVEWRISSDTHTLK